MTETATSKTEPRMAVDVPRGHAVSLPGDDTIVFVKAERQGTEYIHHYLIQLDPAPAADLALIYVDPEDMLVDLDAHPVFVLDDGAATTAPDVGHIFMNNKGTFLKVIEDPKSQKMFAFIDIESGDVCRRQERKVTRVHMEWRIKTIT